MQGIKCRNFFYGVGFKIFLENGEGKYVNVLLMPSKKR
jgi:hypothetical protein